MADTILRKELQEAFLEQGIQDTNFFNGRLLTADDMVKLQDASRRRDHQLGQAFGSGIASGLEVRLLTNGSDGKPPVLAVSKGLAFNRLGQAVALPQDAEILLDKEKPDVLPEAGFFNYCPRLEQDSRPIPGKGAYLLTIRPAFDFKGLAPRRGFGQAAKVEGCDRDLVLEGAQFRLVSIDIDQLTDLTAATRQGLKQLLPAADNTGPSGLAAVNKLRNWLAHACFGTEELQGWLRDPFARESDDFFGSAVRSPFHTYGIVDKLRGLGLIDDCDVPLALVCWTVTGVKWADMWSVRRKLVEPALSTPWPLPLSSRRQAEGEAIFLQFQEQLQSLFSSLSRTGAVEITALDHFRYLPATGFLPITGDLFIRRSPSSRGFRYQRFFQGLTARRPIFIEGAKLQSLVQTSYRYSPVDLYPEIDREHREMFWTYLVRENFLHLDNNPLSYPQAYLVFTSGHIPFAGEAQYDLARWDYSNYGVMVATDTDRAGPELYRR